MLIRLRPAVLALLVLLFASANLIGPSIFWEAAGWDVLQYCALFATGGLMAEACLLAIWAALGPQAAIFRIPLTIGLLLGAACTYIMGLKLPGDGLPSDVALFMLFASLMIFGCMQLPLWGLRFFTQQWIAVPAKTEGANLVQRPAQFGVRHLLIATAMVGILLVLAKRSLPESSVEFGFSEWLLMTACGLVLIAYSAVICLPCVVMVLRDGPNKWWTVAILVPVLGGGPPVACVALETITGAVNAAKEMLLGIHAFGLGTATILMLTLLIVRAIGYRLISPADKRLESPAGPSGR